MDEREQALQSSYALTLHDAEKDARAATQTSLRHDYAQVAEAFRQLGRPAWSREILETLQDRLADSAQFHFVRALSHRDCQTMEEAVVEIERAIELAPDHPDVAFARAQLAYETWRPSAALFESAHSLAKHKLPITKTWALALVAEGQVDSALSLLELTLNKNPDWREGHQQLASIKITHDLDSPFASFGRALREKDRDLALHLAYFYALAQARAWEEAGQALDSVPPEYRSSDTYRMSRVYLLAEMGELESDQIPESLIQRGDAGFDLCLTRHYLRQGHYLRAIEVAERHLGTSQARLFWPYLSLAWRLTDNPRVQWLERGSEFIGEVDLAYSVEKLAALTNTVMGLHTMKAPYVEQSVRGGIQTERNLFFHPSGEIQHLRSKVSNAVADYAAGLPNEPGWHPLLSEVPGDIRFSGSWSVALQSQGYHATHTHVLGWLSSALYLQVPTDQELGSGEAGYLSFGKPPPELGLDLGVTYTVKPAPGRLVLFPSYCWHGTQPFEQGERVTVAFDVAGKGG